MSATATIQPSLTMTQDKGKAVAPGFFSVLLGRGTANLKTEAQTEAAKRPSIDARPAKPARVESTIISAQEQGRASFAAKRGIAPPRSSMTTNRTRTVAKREPRARHTSGNAALEAAVRRHAGALAERPDANNREDTQPRPRASSMRQPKTDRNFVDARDVFDGQDEGKATQRQARKVAFRTPTSSLHKGSGEPNLGAAGSSSESFRAPSPKSRPIPKATKPKHSRAASNADIEGRNRTETWHNRKEQPRSYSSKDRRAKEGVYPFAPEPRRDSFQAIRAPGPDRVIIVPAGDSQPWPATNYSSNAPPGTRRPGPTALAPYARTSHDIGRQRERPAEAQPSSSHRRAVSAAAGPSSAARESGRSRNRVESTPSRPFPTPSAGEDRSHSASRTRTDERVPRAAQRGNTSGSMLMGRERHSSDARARVQRV
ncbi:uncharacterized protein UBRO2_05769 [Ustilago bromivora]|uniref:Uncharacterized protein n=2 Tax=Ustilago bromivora TaxID=307758 RepID=A0A8H8QT98_9BASI|nr:uncharacterized protein UBRO2_05769 [Ustilago bromivora]